MLPLVGVVAVGLLLVGGKLFFLSVPQTERPVLPVIPVAPVSQQRPVQEKPLPPRTDRRELPVERNSSTTPTASADASSEKSERAAASKIEVLAVPYGGSADSSSSDSSSSARQGGRTASRTSGDTDVAAQPLSGKGSQNAQPVREPLRQKDPAPPKKTVWMVQVGAFSTEAAANAVAQDLTKAGYQPRVLPGKLNRVLVPAGSTRAEALAQAEKMGKTGFQGAFIVPPRS
jgi:cell division septation protein DedD